MVDAWSVIVTREPEWDDYTRAEAIASLTVDQYRCRSCGVAGALTEIPKATKHWTWGDGRKFEVLQFRCLACAAEQTVSRDFNTLHEKHKPAPGVFAPGDGVRWVVQEITDDEEVTRDGGTP